MAVRTERGTWGGRGAASFVWFAVAGCVLGGGGCAGRWNPFQKDPLPAGPADSLVLRGDALQPDTLAVDPKTAEQLAGAHELYRQGDYAKAEKTFHKVAANNKNAPSVAEEARFYEAECLRRQLKYPKAADTYNKLLNDFPTGSHRQEAMQHMYEIANYWLEDTREEMRHARERREGKRSADWFEWLPCCHVEKTKPFFDEEGRAVEKLDQVWMNDPKGQLAEQALFMLGTIKNYRGNYSEADAYFSQLVERYPNSKYAPKALEMAVFCKQMGTGGPDYDGRKAAEARELIRKAQYEYPELARSQNVFLDRQKIGITIQEAEKDFRVAEFYRRRGHPGAAYFQYEIVRRRYPGTPYFDKATERMHDLRVKLEKEQKKKGLPPPATPEAAPPEPGATGPEVAPPPRPLDLLPPKAVPELAPPPQKLPATDAAQPELAPVPQKLPAPNGPQLEVAPPPQKLPGSAR